MEFPGYRIKETLYVGKVAEVLLYEHNHTSTDTFVAKVLHSRLQSDDAKVDRFRWQAEMLMKLEHPGIARATEVDTFQGRTYLKLPYYRHGALWKPLAEGKRTEKKRYSWPVVREIARQVAEVLDYCNDPERNEFAPVLHCDIKPQNIIVGSVTEQGVPEKVLLIDFSLDRLPDTGEGSVSKTEVARAGEATAMYQSPEQAAGAEDLDVRSDLFSLGMTLWALLLGDDPPVGKKNRRGRYSEGSLRVDRKDPEFDFATLFDPSWPRDCRLVLHGLLRKDREERPGSAKELLQLLEALDDPSVDIPELKVGEPVECEPLDVFDTKVNELYAKKVEHCYRTEDGRVLSAFLPVGDGGPWPGALIYFLERQFLPWLHENPSPLLPKARGRWESPSGPAYLFDHLSGPSLADCYGRIKNPGLQIFLPHLHPLARLLESLSNDAGDVLCIDWKQVRVQFQADAGDREFGLSAWKGFCECESYSDLPPHRWLVWPHFELQAKREEADFDATVTRTMDLDAHLEELTQHQRYFALLYHLVSGGMNLDPDAYVDTGLYQKTAAMSDASNKLVAECIAGQKSDSLTALLGALASNEGCGSLDGLDYLDGEDFVYHEILEAPEPQVEVPPQPQVALPTPVEGGGEREEELKQIRADLAGVTAERDALASELEPLKARVDEAESGMEKVVAELGLKERALAEKEAEVLALRTELEEAITLRKERDESLLLVAGKLGLDEADPELVDLALEELSRGAREDGERLRAELAERLGVAGDDDEAIGRRIDELREAENARREIERLVAQMEEQLSTAETEKAGLGADLETWRGRCKEFENNQATRVAELEQKGEELRAKEEEIAGLTEELQGALAGRRDRDDLLEKIATKIGLAKDQLAPGDDLAAFDEALREIAKPVEQDSDRFRESIADQLGLPAATEANVESRLKGLLEKEREKKEREKLLDDVATTLGFAGNGYAAREFLAGLDQARHGLEEGAVEQGREEVRMRLETLLEKVEGEKLEDKITTLLAVTQERGEVLERQQEAWRKLAAELELDPSKEWVALAREIPDAWGRMKKELAAKPQDERVVKWRRSLKQLGLTEADLEEPAKAKALKVKLEESGRRGDILREIRETVPGKPVEKDLPATVKKSLRRLQNLESKGGGGRKLQPLMAVVALVLALAGLGGGFLIGQMRGGQVAGEGAEGELAGLGVFVPKPGEYEISGKAEWLGLFQEPNKYGQKLQFTYADQVVPVSGNKVIIGRDGASSLLHLEVLCGSDPEPVDSVAIRYLKEDSIPLGEFLAETSLADITLKGTLGDLKLASRLEDPEGRVRFSILDEQTSTKIDEKGRFFKWYGDLANGLSFQTEAGAVYPLSPSAALQEDDRGLASEAAVYLKKGGTRNEGKKPEWTFRTRSGGDGMGLAFQGHFEGEAFTSVNQEVTLDLARSRLKLRVDWGIGDKDYEELYKTYSEDAAMPVGYDLTLCWEPGQEEGSALEVLGLKEFDGGDEGKVLIARLPDFDRIEAETNGGVGVWSQSWLRCLPGSYQQVRDYTLADRLQGEVLAEPLALNDLSEVAELQPALGTYGIFNTQSFYVWNRFSVAKAAGAGGRRNFDTRLSQVLMGGRPREPYPRDGKNRFQSGADRPFSWACRDQFQGFDVYYKPQEYSLNVLYQHRLKVERVDREGVETEKVPSWDALETAADGSGRRRDFGYSLFLRYIEDVDALDDRVSALLYSKDFTQKHSQFSEAYLVDDPELLAESDEEVQNRQEGVRHLLDVPAIVTVGGRGILRNDGNASDRDDSKVFLTNKVGDRGDTGDIKEFYFGLLNLHPALPDEVKKSIKKSRAVLDEAKLEPVKIKF